MTSARRVAARDQLPRGDTRHTRDGTLIAHPGNRVAGKGEVIRRTAHLGEGARPAPGRLSCSDLGRAQNAGPTEPVPLWSAENLSLRAQTWEVPATQGPPCTVSLQSSLEPEQRSLGKHTRCERGQTQCGPDTVSTAHTRQAYLCTVFLPPHSTTEQASPSK